MQCPRCDSTKISKNGKHHGKENNICRDCGRQFVESYDAKGYSDELKRECLEMYVNGSGFRAIERVKKVHHTTVINWVKQAAQSLPDAPEYSEIPEVAQLDELETFVGKKKQDLAVDSRQPGSSRDSSLGFG
jgi:transposase-like protein